MRQRAAKDHVKVLIKMGLLIATFAALGVACTKKKDPKSMVSADAYLSKADLMGQTFHLSRGVVEADSENTVEAIPGMSDDFGLVQARITEKELQFVSVFDPNGRAETAKIVASYPIVDHFDIQREENDFKEQTHRTVENREKPWTQRQYIRVDWASPTNSISNFAAVSLGDSSLHEENTLLVEEFKNDNGYLSWAVETSLKGDRLFKFTPPFSFELIPAFRVTYRTHLMPFKKSDFKPIAYSLNDFSRFGYFFTQQNWEDPEKGLRDSGVKTYANVFNVCESGRSESCSTNQIVWVLSKNFPKQYLEGARSAVREWNEAFQKALGRNDDVVVLDESVQVEISDPRRNVIAYYPHKTGGGLLGVAQGVENPQTGEKISARATIYEDGIRSVLGQVDTIIDLISSEDPLRDVIKTGALGPGSSQPSPFKGMGSRALFENMKMRSKVLGNDKIKGSRESVGGSAALALKAAKKGFVGSVNASNIRKARLAAQVPDVFAVAELARVKGALVSDARMQDPSAMSATPGLKVPDLGGMEKLLFVQEKLKADRKRMMSEAQKGIHGSELVEDAAVRYLMRLLKEGATPQDLRHQRDTIKAEIAKLTFYTTLLHELGHTFGLRHNFEGSADKKHYHPEYHRLAKIVESEGQQIANGTLKPEQRTVHSEDLEPYAYSSIMDYGDDFYAQSGGLGSYDKAAIKYAYNRGIQKDTDEVTRAGFRFCTDHEVGETILCRRFDKGSNVSEVTYNTIERFQRNWALSHFRRDRVHFDRVTMSTFLGMLQYTMIPVRQVMDEYVYSLISAESVPSSSRTGGFCDYKFVRASVDQKEIGDICDPMKAEQNGVNLTDMETFYAALFDPNSGALRANPSTYVPYGMADLLMANILAQSFFQDVLGSTEPGIYLALPPQQKGLPFNLQELDSSLASDEERLKAFAEENGITDVDKFVQQAKPFVTEVRVGRVGKPLGSQTSTIAGFTRMENIGAFWDKYAAMIALSARDIGATRLGSLIV
jgi:hypothetical protein